MPEAVPVDDLAEPDSTTVAELRHKMSTLMPGVGQSNRLRRIRDPLPRQHLESLVTGKPFRIEPQVDRELCVQTNELGRPHRCRRNPGIKPVGQPRIGVFKRKVDGHWSDRGLRVAATLTIVPAVLHIKGVRVRPLQCDADVVLNMGNVCF